jgi:hypothetical protein
MSLGNTSEADVVAFLMVGTALPGNWPAVAGNYFIALYTSDPGEAGAPNANETTYTGYARIAVTRNAGGWTLAGSQVSNTAAVTFGLCTAGTPTITHAAIVTSSSGAGGQIVVSGALSASLAVSPGVTPSFAIGQLVFSFD